MDAKHTSIEYSALLGLDIAKLTLNAPGMRLEIDGTHEEVKRLVRGIARAAGLTVTETETKE